MWSLPMMHWTSLYSSPHQTWDPPASDIWWLSLETWSHLFTWGPPNQYWHLMAEAHTVGKRAVYILLECVLVLREFEQFVVNRPWVVWRAIIFYVIHREEISLYFGEIQRVDLNLRCSMTLSSLEPTRVISRTQIQCCTTKPKFQTETLGTEGGGAYTALHSSPFIESLAFSSTIHHKLLPNQSSSEASQPYYNISLRILTGHEVDQPWNLLICIITSSNQLSRHLQMSKKGS